MNLLICNWDKAKFLLFSTNVYDPLIYYSHFLPLLSSLILGMYVYFNNRKNNINKIFFLLTISFSSWIFFDLVLWASEKPNLIMFFWSSLIYIEYIIFVLSFWLTYIFIYKKKLPDIYKRIMLILSLPILFLSLSTQNLIAFDWSNCDRGAFEGALWVYLYIVECIICFATAGISFYFLFINKNNAERKESIIFSAGVLIFMMLFVAGNITLLSDMGWNYEQYKLFGMVFFLLTLLFLIVKFKTFSIKVIGSQMLVWIVILLISFQFIFIKTNINKILNLITLVFTIVSSYYLVRSVKLVEKQKDQLEKVNQNQQSLLHFITHQVKGYMTKSRNIFDGMLIGDYGEINPQVKAMAQHGFDSETKGVHTVLTILKASDLKTGKIDFIKEKTNISVLIAKIIAEKKSLAETKGIELTFDIESNVYADVDKIQINEVFKNLISNAITYTQKGAIHVTLKKSKKKMKFSVIDTGFGLTEDDKEKLFTEGGKSTDALSVNIDSTGFGLFIAKKIIEKHKGKIGARSEGRNKGSEFFVILSLIK